MVSTVFATKIGMSQAWTSAGKRLAVTRCRVDNNVVLRSQDISDTEQSLEIGYGIKPLKNVKKPLRTRLEKGGFSVGVKGIKSVRVTRVENESEETNQETAIKLGSTVMAQQVLEVGDIVKVQGTSKGRGFAGGIKRHGFSGGPKTHGQSDRERAVGSIGAGTSPGRVWKGKKMPGHYGVETKTVAGLVVIHVDPETQEVWISGPVPGHIKSIVAISKTGKTKAVELDKDASGIVEKPVVEEAIREGNQAEEQQVAPEPVEVTEPEAKVEEKAE